MTELSPQAQAVYDAYCKEADNPYYYERSGLVAALRAVADQVVPENLRKYENYTNEEIRLNRMHIRSRFLAIAAELEGGND
jgi:hypothetical protein